MKNLYKFISSFLPSLSFIILGYLAYRRYSTFSDQIRSIIYYAPYVILILAGVMAWKFNRSRSFFTSLICILCLVIINNLDKLAASPYDIYLMISILLPFQVIIFSMMKERGIISIWGMFRFAFILLQVYLAFWVITTNQKDILKYLNSTFFPFPLSSMINMIQIVFLIFIFSFLFLMARIMLYHSSQDISFLFILIALFIMLNGNSSIEYSIFFTIIGLILIMSVLKDTYFMAFYDELTSIPSRRALNQDLMKLGMKYSIAMLDIDFFKKFNDTYGHDTGDEVLKFIAAMVKDVKGGGKAYRYGGEEFTILFPGKTGKEVLSSLEDLRETIANRGFVVRKKRCVKSKTHKKTNSNTNRRISYSNNTKKIYIHVSIGIAQKDESNKTPTMVLKAADTALYRAKKKGRNCVSR